MTLDIRVIHDGVRNAAVQVTCCRILSEWVEVIVREDLSPIPKKLRLDSVYYAVSDGIEVQFAWKLASKLVPFLPLGGRGKVDFDEVKGVHAAFGDEGSNIVMRTRILREGVEEADVAFTVVLDLSKHMGASDA